MAIDNNFSHFITTSQPFGDMTVSVVSSLTSMTTSHSTDAFTGVLECNITEIDKQQDIGDLVFEYGWKYVAPIIFILGIVGNTLTILVMRRKRLRGSTACVYLPLIAFFDSLALIFGMIPEWIEASFKYKFKEIHPATCKFEKFSFYTCADVAIWLLVAFNLDRFVAVCFPLKRTKICVNRRAWIIAAGLLLLGFIKNFPVFWTRGYQKFDDGYETNCGRPHEYFEKYVRPWIAFTCVSLIPFIFITTFNAGIIYTLVHLRDITSSDIKINNVCTQTDVRNRRFSQTTIMCIGVSVLFLLTVVPSMILNIGNAYWSKGGNDAYDIAKAVNNIIVYLNHSLNFFLYCLTGRRFRQELVAMCKRLPSGPKTRSVASGLFNIHKLSTLSPIMVDPNPAYKTFYINGAVVSDGESSKV